MTDTLGILLRVWVFVSTHRWFRYASAAVAGLLAALALPSFYILPLLLLIFPGFLWLIQDCDRPFPAFLLGWWFGLGHFVAGLYWVANALLVEGMGFAWAVPFATIALPAVLAVFTGLAALLAFWLIRRGWRPVPALAIAWTVGELLRGHLFTGFPWNLIGSVWTVSDTMSQTAWLVGTYGLSFLTVLVAASPYAVVIGGWRRGRCWLPPAAALLLLVAMAGFGWARLDSGTRFHSDIALRIVQANIPQSQKWDRDLRDDHFITHLRLSEANKEGVTAFIWPETAVAYFLEDEPSRRALIGRFLPEGAVLITGAPRLEREDGILRHLWNSLFVLDSDGHIRASYDKTHLVPFGEYLPFRPVLQFFGLDNIVYGPIDYTPGTERPTIDVASLPPFTPLICYEVIFPGHVLGEDDRPAWLLNVTNDAWYGDTTGPRQHLMTAKLRAIEESLPLVRAAGTGISAIFDSRGRELRSLDFNERGIFDSYLPQAGTPGPFARFGNWIVLALILITGGAASWRHKTRQRD